MKKLLLVTCSIVFMVAGTVQAAEPSAQCTNLTQQSLDQELVCQFERNYVAYTFKNVNAEPSAENQIYFDVALNLFDGCKRDVTQTCDEVPADTDILNACQSITNSLTKGPLCQTEGSNVTKTQRDYAAAPTADNSQKLTVALTNMMNCTSAFSRICAATLR